MSDLSDDEAAALDAQQALVESSLALVFRTYDDAIAEGVAAPVVVLLDCEDELAGQIVREWLGDEAVGDAIADRQAADDGAETTVFARAVPLHLAARELPRVFPYLAPVFAGEPPRGGVLVVGVTAGGASALTAPDDAR